ncbi:GTPase, partial [Haemophilus influenzae]|uniref:GTPase n=1 Tax=Haemophilus influenzae TaxID=727 RepID=UPI000CB2ECEE
ASEQLTAQDRQLLEISQDTNRIILLNKTDLPETDDIVEQIGVERSKKALKEADLVLLVLNASEQLTAQDRQLLEISQDTNRIILLNKTDLPET